MFISLNQNCVTNNNLSSLVYVSRSQCDTHQDLVPKSPAGDCVDKLFIYALFHEYTSYGCRMVVDILYIQARAT